MIRELSGKPAEAEEKWIAHFGGSFNPIHDGHLAIAQKLIAHYGFDQVVFCPNGDQYGKSGLAPETARYALLQKAIENEDKMTVDDYELNHNHCVIHTIETIKYLHDMLTEKGESFQLFCIRGSDAIEKMQSWRSLPDLMTYATIIVIPRSGTDMETMFTQHKTLADLSDGFVVMDNQGIPPVSSSDIRRKILSKKRTNLPLPSGLLEEMKRRGMYGFLPPGENEIILYRPGYSGGKKSLRDQNRNEVFGHGTWRTMFRWGDDIITYNEALMLYEDAYIEYFRKHPEELEWISKTGCNVFDNSDSNVMCGTDYAIQEAISTHLQDIAVRRCLIRLGRRFEGDHLVEIRGRDTEGFRLNPGQVDFHLPQFLVTPEPESWWMQGSVEAFWQTNKIFLVKECVFTQTKALIFHLFALNDKGEVLSEMRESRAVRLPSFAFTGNSDYSTSLKQFLETLGLDEKDIEPTLTAPVVNDDDVHILWQTTVTITNPPEGMKYVKLQTAKSMFRYKPAQETPENVIE